jgi:hypothetical protein
MQFTTETTGTLQAAQHLARFAWDFLAEFQEAAEALRSEIAASGALVYGSDIELAVLHSTANAPVPGVVVQLGQREGMLTLTTSVRKGTNAGLSAAAHSEKREVFSLWLESRLDALLPCASVRILAAQEWSLVVATLDPELADIIDDMYRNRFPEVGQERVK